MNKEMITLVIEDLKDEIEFGSITRDQALTQAKGMIRILKVSDEKLSKFLVSEFRRVIQ